MSEVIYRQVAIDAICQDWCGTSNTDCKTPFNPSTDDYYHCDGCGDVQLIKALPSADVQPVHTGERIYGEKDGADGWYCSECKFHVPWYYEYYGLNNIDFIRDYHVCPHCGAKMPKYTGMGGEQHDEMGG